MAPIFAHSKIRRYELHDKLLSLQCKEDFPSPEWNYAFTGIFLFVQYILPLIIIPFVHSKIVIFLRYVSNWNFSCYIQNVKGLTWYFHFSRKNSGFQNDARRKEREIKRNRRMTLILSCIGIIFAISWLPYHIYFILVDIVLLFQVSKSFPCVSGSILLY